MFRLTNSRNWTLWILWWCILADVSAWKKKVIVLSWCRGHNCVDLTLFFWDTLRRNLSVELFDGRLLFWMEPHVLIWRSLMTCSVQCQALLPRAFGQSWQVPALWSRASSTAPACSCPFPWRTRQQPRDRSSSGVFSSWMPTRAAVSL